MNLKPKFLQRKSTDFKIHHEENHVHYKIINEIKAQLPKSPYRPIVVVCIGTDRSTGDSLGPLVGTKLSEKSRQPYIVHGTLDHPIHAVNLEEQMQAIHKTIKNPFIIGIDACLGKMKHVGMVSVGEGPVMPGAGVQKELPPIGDMHLTGIVNVSGFMEYFVLQNTRLNLVMKLANIIADSIHIATLSHVREFSYTNINIIK